MRRSSLLALLLALAACAHTGSPAPPASFSIAVIPDTQNYLDYTHQTAEGFAFDASELFLAQMRDVARRAAGSGGDVVFVASVGDVWQHQTETIDPEHAARGFEAVPNPVLAFPPRAQVESVEIPKAIEGYRILSDAGLPFGVAPGNHDHDAMWTDKQFPPNLEKLRNDPASIRMVPEDLGILHIGGLDNFRSAFGADSEFFRDKPWYVDHYGGGANSAQVFAAGGYEFLHIAIEMQPPDEVLGWVRGVLARHPGKPAIVTTHDYLSTAGERRPNPIVDLERLDPERHNSAEELWQKLLSQEDPIFLVLCGHQHGQSRRVDLNVHGHEVHQLLADYQSRGQAARDGGAGPGRMGRTPGLGDGWYRLMRFDLGGPVAKLRVTTYSSHYRTTSRELPHYAEWYRAQEQPQASEAEFHAMDDFVLELGDFFERFGPAGPR